MSPPPYVDLPLSSMLYIVDYAHGFNVVTNILLFRWKYDSDGGFFNGSLLLRQDLFCYCDPL